MKNLIRKILKESEDDGLDWIRDIKVSDIWYYDNFNLKQLDGLKFKTKHPQSYIYSFSYDHTTHPETTLIYRLDMKPKEIVGGYSNGAPWTWRDIRTNFIKGDWILID